MTNTDIHLGYGRDLMKGYHLEAFVDAINVFNQEQQASVDEDYTLDNTNPIVGGTYEDLVYAKQNIVGTGAESSDPVTRWRNFGNTSGRYTPLYIRFGMRLSF